MCNEEALKKVIGILMSQLEEERQLREDLVKFLITGKFFISSRKIISEKDIENKILELSGVGS
jgi:hypothetical protein